MFRSLFYSGHGAHVFFDSEHDRCCPVTGVSDRKFLGLHPGLCSLCCGLLVGFLSLWVSRAYRCLVC